MEQVTLSAERRAESGSRAARRMRRTGKVPAIVYGRGLDPLSVSVGSRELYTALHTEAGTNAILSVEIGGSDPVLAVAREIQRHPVRGEVTHLDLIKVSLDVAIEAEVSIEYIGIPIGVREEAGIVETIGTSVMIEALPTAIPSSIPLDISHLNIGDGLKVEDLPETEGVTLLDEPDRPLVTVLAPRLIEEEVVGEAELEFDAEGEPIVVDADAAGEEGEAS
ncbi:MAG TPA: 50S ribosomal protein L25 [Acidimicrobiia bacterium]|nr:50S ribosomal protein L25 [Acidimicrobiia bacterium]